MNNHSRHFAVRFFRCLIPAVAALLTILSSFAGQETAFRFDSVSYSAAEGGTISGTVTRYPVTTTCQASCNWFPNQQASCLLELNPSGTYPISAPDLPANWQDGLETVTFPPNVLTVGFSIPLVQNSSVQYDRTGTVSIGSGLVDSGAIQDATVTLLDDDSTVSVLIFSGGNYYTGTQILEGGTSGANATTIRFIRNQNQTQARTINYNLAGSSTSSGDYTPSLSGTVTIPNASDFVDVTVTAVNDSSNEGSETLSVNLAGGIYQIDPVYNSVGVEILDNFPTVTVGAITPAIVEGGQSAFVIQRSPAYGASGTKTVNYHITATATSGQDYTASPSLSGTITIGAGQAFTNILISSLLDTNVEGVENLTLVLDSGVYTIGNPGNALIYIADDYPTVNIVASAPTAFELGTTPGYFTLTRDRNLSKALTVHYQVSGTAVTGTHYSPSLGTSVTFAVGQTATNLAVMPLDNGVLDDPHTVVVTLQTNVSYIVGAHNQARVTIVSEIQENERTPAIGLRYFRSEPHPATVIYPQYIFWDFTTSILPLDGQTGVQFESVDGSLATNFVNRPWTDLRYHIDWYKELQDLPQNILTNRVEFNNPIVAFGGGHGGSPLYIGQPYSFGIYSGLPAPAYQPIRIAVYNRTNGSYAGEILLPVLNPNDLSNWTNYANGGFEKTVEGFGLKSTLRILPNLSWGTSPDGTYVITHEASDTAEGYYYLLEITGYADASTPMAITAGGAATASRLYTLEFETRPNWLTTLWGQPHFSGTPMPPVYDGKSLDELLSVQANLTNQLPEAALSHTNLNGSPELRSHPLLEQLVIDLRRDPIALANYVQNEIELTDPIGLNADGSHSEQAVHLGGVNRSALGTYLEGQGSPIEQCALLVYLLRAANVPATYVFAPPQGLNLLDERLSRLWRVRIPWGHDAVDRLYTTHQLISVNYPWVAAYVNGRWVHLFPWLKEHEVVEGMDLRDFLPANYPDAYSWVRDYVLGKTNLMTFASATDNTFAHIYPRWLHDSLQQTAPGLSTEDIGLRWRIRPQYRARWEDFPQPTQVTNSFTAVESLSSSSITDVSPTLTNLFNTVSVEIFSKANPLKRIATPPLRMTDLNDRKFYITHVATNAAHQLQLNLAPFGTNTTGTGIFTDADLLRRQRLTLALDGTDDELLIRLVVREHRAITPQTPIVPNFPFMDITEPETIIQERRLNKGDLAALCFAPGRVTKRMLDVHARELWQHENLLNSGGTPDADIFNGTLVYLMGMSYYERANRASQWILNLTKMQTMSTRCMGLAIISATRDAFGLVSGQPDFTKPALDMFYFYSVVGIGNTTARLDSGHSRDEAARDASIFLAAAHSSEEHQTLNVFLRQTNAVSTVSLLQMAESRSSSSNRGVIFLTAANANEEGAVSYQGQPLNQSDLWEGVVTFFNDPYDRSRGIGFITPGAITNSTGAFRGLAFLGLGYRQTPALIGRNLNGAYAGEWLVINGISAANANNIAIREDADGNYYMNFRPVDASNRTVAPDVVTQFDLLQAAFNADSGFYYTTEAQNLRSRMAVNAGISAGGASPGELFGSAIEADFNRGDAGNVGFYDKQDGLVADPVSPLTGEFYHEDVDLNLPGPFPLQLRRNYSSQNLADNQFGHGWRINYLPFLSVSVDSNVIYAAEMDGSTLAYERQGTNLWKVTPNRNPLLDNNPIQGAGSTANRLRQYIVQTNSTYTLFGSDGSVRTYQLSPFAGAPAQRPFLMRWQDNRGNEFAFEYNTSTNQPDFGELRRIQAGNGNSLGFYFDAAGHIVEAYTGDGRRVKYDYDQFGDLVKVTRADNSEISFEYAHGFQNVTNGAVVTIQPYSTHLLVRETKPDGRLLVNQYDGLRRVTNQLATVGVDLTPVRNATFIYANNFNLTNSFTNLITGTTVIYDAFNNPLTYQYADGLITNIVDALSNSQARVWWQSSETNQVGYYPRSLKRKIDRRNLITDFYYDASGNMVSNVVRGDITGSGNVTEQAVTAYTYNSNNLPVDVTSPVGNTIRTVYDPVFQWFPQQSISLVGATPVRTNWHAYYSVTNTVTNGVTIYTNVARGLLRQQITAYGSADAATNEWVHDGRGFATQVTRYTGTADPAVTLTLTHNNRGQLIEQRDAANRSTFFTYDGLGQQQSKEVFDENGQRIAWEFAYFNENGEMTWTDGPRFDPEDYVWRDYDGAGRLSQTVRWRTAARADGSGVAAIAGDAGFATAWNEFDAFGNLTRTIDARGAITTNIWDALGRVIQRKSFDLDGTAILTTESFVYEPGGSVRYHTNALGGVTETQYTTTGQPKFRRTADGSTNAIRYYVDGRIHREILRNGAYFESTYDDANRKTTRVFYSASGVAQATNISIMDRRGNLVRTIDAGGNVFTNLYDGLDRLKIAAGPPIVSVVADCPFVPTCGVYVTNILQQAITNFYDAAGVFTTNVNALGEKTVTQYDALGRVASVQVFAAGSSTPLRVVGTSYASNHHGFAVTSGSGTNAVSTATWTDNDGNTVLIVRSPSTGLLDYTLHAYDPNGNCTERDQLSTDGISIDLWSFDIRTYDGLNRVKSQTVRDNAETTFSYDALGSVTNRVMPGGLQWNAIYNNAGQMLKEWNTGTGGAGAHTNTYTYYTSGHAFAGLLETRTDARGLADTHTYDDWLRLKDVQHTTGSPYTQLFTELRYDARGFATNITEHEGGSINGPNPRVVLRSFDAYGQMTSESISVNGVGFSTASQAWDAAGRRSLLSFNDKTYGFGWRADGLLASLSSPAGGGSFNHDTAGILTSRNFGGRTVTVSSRDGTGRPLQVNTAISGTNVLQETLNWLPNGQLATHTISRPDYTDSRSYGYTPYSRRLSQEQLDITASQRWTNSFTFDGGTGGGIGVLTKTASSAQWSGAVDAFSRINYETNAALRRPAHGNVNGAATLTATLDGQALGITIPNGSTNGGTWRSVLSLTPGPHQLVVTAKHPSGLFTTNAVSWFTNTASGGDRVEDSYNNAGMVIKRVWRKPDGTTNRTQELYWDAKGRLYQMAEKDAQQNGYLMLMDYDALDRRLRTRAFATTSGGTPMEGATPETIQSYYDPLVEFLELGVNHDGQTTWKAYGPDLSGQYGGMQGVGGLEAAQRGLAFSVVLITDALGNVHGEYSTGNGNLTWSGVRPTAYGAVPGRQPVPLAYGGSFSETFAWRGRWKDVGGHYWIGKRFYDPEGGRWLSYDPVWNAGDANGYTFCAGDPLNIGDWDGRFGRQVDRGEYNALVQDLRQIYGQYYRIGLANMGIAHQWHSSDEPFLVALARIIGEPLPARSFSSRVSSFASGVGMTALGFVPWVADGMDMYTVVAPDSSGLDRTISGASLGANMWSLGLLPNAGPIRNGLRRIADAFSSAPVPHTPHVPIAPPTPPHTPVTPPSAPPAAPSGPPVRPSNSSSYSVGYEARLQRGAHYPGVSDQRHFQESNRQLYEAFQADPRFAQQMEELYPGIIEGVQPGARGAFPRNAPTPDVTWHHHPDREGVMQLVPYDQHTAPGPVQQSLHPGGRGGMENWGGGRK